MLYPTHCDNFEHFNAQDEQIHDYKGLLSIAIETHFVNYIIYILFILGLPYQSYSERESLVGRDVSALALKHYEGAVAENSSSHCVTRCRIYDYQISGRSSCTCRITQDYNRVQINYLEI